jgi:hypothetical protein
MTKGIFDLQTPRDLFNKLEHDLGRMRNNPADSYPAFDFFVTANHMFEWSYPELRHKDNPFDEFLTGKSEHDRELLKLCRAVANGSKHFKENKSTALRGAAFDPHAFDTNHQVGRLTVELQGNQVDALLFAEQIVEFWKKCPRVSAVE